MIWIIGCCQILDNIDSTELEHRPKRAKRDHNMFLDVTPVIDDDIEWTVLRIQALQFFGVALIALPNNNSFTEIKHLFLDVDANDCCGLEIVPPYLE